MIIRQSFLPGGGERRSRAPALPGFLQPCFVFLQFLDVLGFDLASKKCSNDAPTNNAIAIYTNLSRRPLFFRYSDDFLYQSLSSCVSKTGKKDYSSDSSANI